MFNLDKVHIILDEMILNGHVVETNKSRILAPLLALDKMAESWEWEPLPWRLWGDHTIPCMLWQEWSCRRGPMPKRTCMQQSLLFILLTMLFSQMGSPILISKRCGTCQNSCHEHQKRKKTMTLYTLQTFLMIFFCLFSWSIHIWKYLFTSNCNLS